MSLLITTITEQGLSLSNCSALTRVSGLIGVISLILFDPALVLESNIFPSRLPVAQHTRTIVAPHSRQIPSIVIFSRNLSLITNLRLEIPSPILQPRFRLALHQVLSTDENEFPVPTDPRDHLLRPPLLESSAPFCAGTSISRK